MKKFDWASFFSNILAVVLGIFITFGIQGLIDRRSEKKDVLSALELVKEELVNNKAGLMEVIGIVCSEKEAAEYINSKLGKFSQADADTIVAMNAVLGNDYYFTVTDDALELLKSSSLFQKINDKSLALGIIRAYDYLAANSQAFNTHEKYKTSLYGDISSDRVKKASLSSAGTDFFRIFYSSDEGRYFLKSVIEMSDDYYLRAGIPEIEEAIKDIESRLR